MPTIHSKDLKYSAADVMLSGIVFSPAEIPLLHPAVVVFHDAMGIGTHTLDNARTLAKLGLSVLVADLYGSGTPPRDTAHAIQLMNHLRGNTDLWRARAQAAFDALTTLPGVDRERLGALGHCFGGSTALELLRHGAPLRAAVCMHGVLQSSQPAARGLAACSVLVCTGADDPLVPPSQIVEFLGEMQEAEIDCQTVIYSGARHAFTMPSADTLNMPAMAYHPSAHKRSWAAMERLFAEVLGLA